MALLHSGLLRGGGRTLEQMVVERRVGGEHCCHLIVVRRMDVLINTVARELHLQREGGSDASPVSPGWVQTSPVSPEWTHRVCHRLTSCQGQDLGLSLQLTPWPNAEVKTCSSLQGSELSLHPHSHPRGKAKSTGLSCQGVCAEEVRGREQKLKGGGGTMERSLGSVLQTESISKQTQAGALSVTLTYMLCERNDQLETSCLGPSAPPWRATSTQRLTSWEPWRRIPCHSDKGPFCISTEACPRHCQSSRVLPGMRL